ncbi:serine incorporator 1 isoform X4 [Ananas comosus]|uniref:Serine incorporator 1 isoform X4 n=1 Tax=Ananas comosus TaxID=4615 RepID=A0A6P5EPD9_ANACO|nr:serine incorporator 1 isoform X4 [Ananas comosus]
MTGNPSEPVGNFTIDDDVRNEEVGKPQVLVDKRETAYAVRRKQSLRARYIFGFIFFTTNLLAWFFRDYGYKILHGLRREVARIGAGIFLLLQLISMLQFLAWCNSQWMPDPQSGRCLIFSGFFGLFLSTISYIASFSGIVLMYIMYAPHLSCIINIFSITWTAILVIIMMIVSLHSKVNNGLLSSGIMGLYIVFLCWSAIESEPQNEKCKTPKKMAENGDWTTIVCFLIALCAIVMATFSTGIDTRSFQFVKDEAQLEDDIPYRYEIFHFVFSMGAMYFAMLFISWELDHPTRKWSIDVGWASTWVKIINEWLAASIYLWKLISPVIMRDNAIHHEESMQNVHSLV